MVFRDWTRPVTLMAAILTLPAVSDATAESQGRRSAERENETLELRSSDLGMNGPLELNTTYSKDRGTIVGGRFTTGIGDRNAASLEVEGGENLMRLNATWGLELTQQHRIKATIERLAQKLDYNFRSGDVSKWSGQNAAGLGYQYIVPHEKSPVKTVDLNGYWAKAKSHDLKDKLYTQGGDTYLNERRIAGATSTGFSAGVTGSLWPTNKIKLSLDYDSVKYDTKLATKNYDTSGFGGTVEVDQLLTETLKANLLTSIRTPQNEYGAGVSWLAPVQPGTQLELGVNGSYMNSKTTKRKNRQMAMTVNYKWGGPADGGRAKYNKPNFAAVESLVEWTKTPAVRMAEVRAIADQRDRDRKVSPKALPIGDVEVFSGDPVELDVSENFIDPNGSRFVYSASGHPNGVSFDGEAGTFSGTAPTVDKDTPHKITVTGTNRYGLQVSESFTLTVKPATQALLPPNSSPIPDVEENEDTPVTASVESYFEDPNAQQNKMSKGIAAASKRASKKVGGQTTMTFKAVGLPAGIHFDNKTGVATGKTPKVDADTRYPVTVTADNGVGTASESFMLTVKHLMSNVTSTSISAASVDEESPVSLDVSNNFSDEKGGNLTYSATGLSGTGLTIDSATGVISGTTIAVDQDRGFTISVTATNKDGNKATETFTLTIKNVASTVTSTGIPSVSVNEETPYTLDVSGNFSDTKDGELTYTATGLEGTGLTINSETGVINGTSTDVDQDRDFTVTITAENADGNKAEETFTLTIKPIAGVVTSTALSDVTITEETAYSLDVRNNFSDSKDNALTYTAIGLEGSGLSMSSDGIISGTTASVNSDSIYTITVTASNADGKSASESFKLTIENVMGAVNSTPIPAVVVNEETPYNLDVTRYFSDTKGDTLTYTATGLDAAGLTMSSDGQINGTTIAVTQDTPFSAVITALNTTGSESAQTLKITVKNVPAVVTTAANIPDDSVAEGAAYNLDTTQYFSDSKDGALTYSATGLSGTGLTLNSDGQISGTATEVAQDTPFNITVTATNAEGSSASASYTLTIKNIPALVNAGQIPDQTVDEGKGLNLDVTTYFSDSKDGQLTYTASGLTGTGMTISNDGVISGTAVDVNQDETVDVTVTATNVDGNSASSSFKLTIKDISTPPVLNTPIADQTVNLGDSIKDVVLTEHFGGDNLGFTQKGLPNGVSLDSDKISGIPAQIGEYSVTVTATNASNQTVSDTFKITVKELPPVATKQVPDQTIVIGESIQQIDLNEYFSGTNLVFKQFVLPAGVSLNGSIISGIPERVGRHVSAVYAVNSTGEEQGREQVFTINVLDIAPTLDNPIPDQTIKFGDSIKPVVLDAHFSGDGLTYKADGLPAGVSLNNKVISGKPADKNISEYSVTVYASKNNSEKVEDTFKITVLQEAPPEALTPKITRELTYLLGEYIEPIDLKQYFKGENLKFKADGMHSWMSLDDGVISGMPIKPVRFIAEASNEAGKATILIDIYMRDRPGWYPDETGTGPVEH